MLPAVEQMDVASLEAELAAIPEVRAARVVSAPNGRIVEVHIVSEGGKSPKQLVRDVQTVAQAKVGIPIDHRVISVVQFPGNVTGPDAPPPRFSLGSFAWTTEGTRATCRVRIEAGDESVLGEASGAASSVGRLRLTADAMRDAFASLVAGPVAIDVADVRVVDVAGQRVAVAVVVVLEEERDEVVASGSAPVRGDENEAVARAILDAVARHHGA